MIRNEVEGGDKIINYKELKIAEVQQLYPQKWPLFRSWRKKRAQRRQSSLQHFCEVDVAFSFYTRGNSISDGEDEGVKIEVCPMKMGI